MKNIRKARSRYDRTRPIGEWAKEFVESLNHEERMAILEEFNRIQREEHALRLEARE